MLLVKYTREDISIENEWTKFILSNYELISEKLRPVADMFKRVDKVNEVEGFTNIFCIDGYSMECIFELIDDIENNSKKNSKSINLPNIDLNAPTLFYNRAEGFGADIIFDGIHKIVDIIGFKGKIVYTNCAFNLQEQYDNYCTKYNVKPRIECYYNGNPSFHHVGNKFYHLPNPIPEPEPISQRKLYCSFNWNAWDHRLAMISMLHYYDLLMDGYVTSPGVHKFEYNSITDYNLLVERSGMYLKSLPNVDEIIKKLETLRTNYPLKIDDRSKYTFTDEPLWDLQLKIPLYKARINSFFEIINETRFYGEHFFSEKTFYPIILCKPFLIMSSHGALKSLKKLGYKTFSPFVNEEYDNIRNDAERVEAIAKEMQRLQLMRRTTPGKFYQLCDNLRVLCQYNLEFFTNEAHRSRHHGEDLSFLYRLYDVNV